MQTVTQGRFVQSAHKGYGRLVIAVLVVMGAVLTLGVTVVPDASTSGASANPLFEWQNANVSQVEVGGEHTCAIQNGVLFCWGAGTQGQLGYLPPPRPPVLPSPTDQLRPVRVSPASGFLNAGNVTTVSASGAVTCAIEAGIVYCWGANGVGQLGIGTYTSREATPRKVASVSGGFQNNGTVTAVSVDGTGVCAIQGGVVYCWGANGLGAVGNGKVTSFQVVGCAGCEGHPSTPRRVVDNDPFRIVNDRFVNGGVTAVTRGMTTCAIKNVNGGELFCWGAGSSGQIGIGRFDNANPEPRKVSSGTDGFANDNVVAVTSTGISVCAVRNQSGSKVMYCWGNGGYGNHGNGTNAVQQTTPRKVSSVAGGMTNSDVTSHHVANASCAVDAGTVYCFGINWYGMVGDGTTTQRMSPTRVSSAGGMPNVAVTMVSAETDHACALEGGSVYCWGRAAKGRLGNEETTPDRLFPVAAASTPGAPTLTGATVGTTTATVTISAGAGGVPTTYTVTASATNGTTVVQTCPVVTPPAGCTITGLDPNVIYTFTATASSDKGTSPASNSLTRTTGATTIPDPPGVVAGIGAVTVSVSPTTSGGTPTGYLATSSPDGGTCTILSPATSCVISPLTNGATSAVTLQAFNDAGLSGASAATTVTVGATAPPEAPTITVGNQSATVSVSPNTSGGTPTHYTVTALPGPFTCTVTPPDTDCALTGLTNGTDYTFEVTATNGGGTSGPSASVTQVVDILAVPTTPSVEVASDGVTVSVGTDPSGGTVDSHEVYLEPDGHRCTIIDPATTCFIPLTPTNPATAYTVTTTAINGIGTSSASPAYNFDFAAPGEPQVGVITVANGSATVTVSAGSPGGPPSSYIVYAGPGSCTVIVPDVSCTISGLTDGQTYTVTASATNGLGTTTTSAGPSATLGPPGTPNGAPTVVVGNGSATVTVAPVTTGGMPAYYLVVAQPGNHQCLAFVSATTSVNSCTLTGLPNGVHYTVTTAAVNDFGTSSSSESATELVDVAPSTPNVPTVVVSNGGVTITMSSPSGGGSVATYSATVMPGGLTCTVSMPTSPASCFIALTTTSAYTVTVTASNDLPATSAATAPLEFRFEGPPAPVVQSVAIGLGTVTVSVAPGTGTGGAANFFTVYVGPSSCTVTPPATSCTVTGLTGGESYTVTASATNGITTTPGVGGLEARLIAPQSPPEPIVMIDSPTSATVYVNPPLGGELPSSYTVTATTSAGVGASCTVVSPDVSCELSPLTAGAEYSVDVVARNDYGPSQPGVPATVLLVAPTVPLAPSVTPGDGRVVVNVRPGPGGGPASEYVVFVEPGSLTCDGGDSIRPPDTSCVVSGLTNDVEYTFTMVAVNGVGGSSTSAVTTATPRVPISLPPGLGGLITSPVPTTTPPGTAPSTTVPATRPPTSTVPPTTTVPSPVVDPTTGVLPALAPGALTVSENNVAVPVEVSVISTTQVGVVSAGFELYLEAECVSSCVVTTTAEGQPVIQLEEGGGVRVTGTGFQPGTLAVVWVFSEPRALGTVTVNADGSFAGVLPLGDLERGQHTLQVSGISATGAPRVANLGVLVNEAGVPTPGPGRLPATGNDSSTPLTNLALLLMLTGAMILTSRRRPVRS